MTRIAEIEARLKAATPGPWCQGGCSGRMISTPDGYMGDGFLADVDTKDKGDPMNLPLSEEKRHDDRN